ncbi:DUF6630 family protein [Halocynthiibacter sp.]|uniref:DUF6630 family protein n=1 Tax=Halocynthiibacter sp. TaxID=1979210 RepID=UPI003C4E36C2
MLRNLITGLTALLVTPAGASANACVTPAQFMPFTRLLEISETGTFAQFQDIYCDRKALWGEDVEDWEYIDAFLYEHEIMLWIDWKQDMRYLLDPQGGLASLQNIFRRSDVEPLTEVERASILDIIEPDWRNNIYATEGNMYDGGYKELHEFIRARGRELVILSNGSDGYGLMLIPVERLTELRALELVFYNIYTLEEYF